MDRAAAPRPLALHLALAAGAAGRAALAEPAPTRAHAPNAPAGADARAAENLATALARLDAMLAGIDAWRRHPWRRAPETAPVLWQCGSCRLLDYAPGAAAPPLLVVPSLINRFWILDLLPERSLLRWLAGRGWRPLLLDWGSPGREECGFDLADHVERRLAPALALAARSGPVDLLGYCLGGNLALAASQLHPELCRRLVLLATPWDFAAAPGRGAVLREMALQTGEPALRGWIRELGTGLGGIPVELLQAIFALLDPDPAGKFAAHGARPQAGAEARAFTATEDWLNHGVPLAPRAGEELLIDWCLGNAPMQGRWRVGGEAIRPERVAQPALVIASASDRISPPASVRPLADSIPGATWRQVRAGHVGMMAGSRAEAVLWEPLHAWLAAG